MANEIALTAKLVFSNTGANVRKSEKLNVDAATAFYTSQLQLIGTSEEALVFTADMVTPGYCIMKNIDATNFIRIAGISGQYMIKLKPLEIALFRIATAGLFAIADTASCGLEYTVIDS